MSLCRLFFQVLASDFAKNKTRNHLVSWAVGANFKDIVELMKSKIGKGTFDSIENT